MNRRNVYLMPLLPEAGRLEQFQKLDGNGFLTIKLVRDSSSLCFQSLFYYPFMSKEIEKKFLLRNLPSGIGEKTKILQGYLSVGDPEVRVRSKGDKFFLTRKGGEGFVREEEEYEISRQVFDILWSLTENARIEKTR